MGLMLLVLCCIHVNGMVDAALGVVEATYSQQPVHLEYCISIRNTHYGVEEGSSPTFHHLYVCTLT
jgi:hypothetical protein